jgi:TRAP-type C4-dicarboxylate transport system substrate-binding protein
MPLRATLALPLLLLATRPAEGEPVVVKMATIAPEGSQYHLILREMVEKWRSASGGAVEVRLYPGSVAGDDVDVIRKMRLGTLNAALLTSVGVAAVDKSVYALETPMLYDSYEEIDYVLGKMAPKIEAALEAKGFVVLNWVDGGWVHFFTKTPVTRPDDLKPLKLFAWAGDAQALEIWKGAGFNPVPLPSTEISTALQTGLVSALPSPPQAAVLLQWYTHAKNMTDVKWALLLGATLVNKATWEKIPEASRPVLKAAAQEAGKRLREESRQAGPRDVQAMRKRGLNVVVLDAKDEALWRAAAESTYDRIRGKIIPAEAFDEAKRHVADFRKLKQAAGAR